MAKTEQILAAAEAVLYREGFRATGVDRLLAAAGVTPRTFYRHFRTKDDLVRAVLERREARYFAHLERSVARQGASGSELLACFDALADWLGSEGDRGCLFLRATGAYGAQVPAIAELAGAHKLRVLGELRRRVDALGIDAESGLAERLLLLMEGATALAPVLGAAMACGHARAAAADLLAAAREEATP